MFHVALLVVADVFAIFQTFALAYALRSSADKPLSQYMPIGQFGGIVAALSPLWVTFFAAAGLYSVRHRRGKPSELGRVAVVVAAIAMALIVLEYELPGRAILPSRAVPLLALPIGIVLVFAGRLIVRKALHAAQRQGYALHRVVIVGGGELAQRISADMAAAGSGYQVLGIVDPAHDGGSTALGRPVVGSLDHALERWQGEIDEIVQADVDLDRGEIARMMSSTTSAGITYRFVPDQYGVYAASSQLTTVAGIPVMDVRLTALDGWGAVGKRAFDLVATAGIMLVLSPLLLTLAALVKLTDPSGPVFYCQNRIGRGGAAVRVLKFRSMKWAYSTGPGKPFETAQAAFTAMGREDLIAEFERDLKVHDDPRITGLGRFIRKFSLDELPQLLNVMRGELSLIGPRPITPEELERYGAQRASFLALKPGITGLWQVSGRNDVSYDERVKLDVFYVENWSMKLDLAILAKTTTAVLAKRGAY